ncbi:MAG: right-handed parallel beta-helix repeat-containing protein [Planctomycetota bacterium]
MKSYFGLIVSMLFMAAVAAAETIKVPGDYSLIQEAIDWAENGDTVLVAPGSYIENIDFKGKAISIKSESGPRTTVIDGRNPANPDQGSVATFQSNEGMDSILDGFTLANGSGNLMPLGYHAGGGIFCANWSYPSIRNNIILKNKAFAGGGIFYKDAFPAVTNNIICENSATYGSGIYCDTDLSFSRISNNVIKENAADWSGGGIFCLAASPAVTNNVFAHNTALAWGGGISCDYAAPVITNNTVFANSVGQGGGGMRLFLSSAKVVNSIFWSNSAPEGPEIILSVQRAPSVLKISHCDVEGGQASIHIDPGCSLDWGSGMIDAPPLFVDEAQADLHLTFDSPCRNGGDNNAVPLGLVNDFEGDPRIAHDIVDMGADEFYTHLYYLGEATPGGDIEAKLVGLPGTSPVGLFLGSGILDPPMIVVWGNFHLQPPWILLPLAPISPEGILVLPAAIPDVPPAPYRLPMQALIGLNPDSLTNLCVLEVL